MRKKFKLKNETEKNFFQWWQEEKKIHNSGADKRGNWTGNKNKQKNENGLKRPTTPYFLFCQEQRDELKKKGEEKKLTAKELGAMWKKLPDTKKKPFIAKYEEEKKKYEKLKDEMGNKSEEEDSDVEEEKKPKKKTSKAKAKTKKSQNDKKNCKACNCGECDECLKGKKKKTKKAKKEEEDDAKKEPKKNKDEEEPVSDVSKEEKIIINYEITEPNSSINKIKIFDPIFVQNNKDKVSVIINQKKQNNLKAYYQTIDKETKLEVILIKGKIKGLKNRPMITDMSYMLNNCKNVSNVTFSNWDTKNVTSMEAMFQLCSFKGAPHLSHLNNKNLQNIRAMFCKCTHISDLSDFEKWLQKDNKIEEKKNLEKI